MSRAIIFYCKDCGGWIFACRKNEQIIKDSKDQIILYLAEGHRIEEVDLDSANINVDPCSCIEKLIEGG